MKTLNTLLLFLILFGLIGCKSEPKVSDSGSSDSKITEDLSAITSYLPILFIPPCDYFAELEVLDINLNPNLVNPTQNSIKYDNTRLEALNLGVYLADLSYLLLIGEKESVSDYLKEIQTFSNKLRLNLLMAENLIKRININSQNHDSLCIISADFQENILTELEFSHREEIVALITIGTFIEALHLSMSNLLAYNDYSLINNELNNHKHIFIQYQKYLEQFSDNPRILLTLSQISELQTFFDKLKTSSNNRKVIKSDNSNISISGGSQIIITPDDFKELLAIVSTVRNRITMN